MRSDRRVVVWVTILGLFLLTVAVAAFLWYYRPTVEYAYVDVMDLRGSTPRARYLGTIVSVALLVASASVWWFLRRRKP
jgi:hypothetical protein